VGRSIRVLVVDDSSVARALLTEGLGQDPLITVVGAARDAYEARDLIVELGPDVVTLDIDMPRMDGVAFLRRLMPQYPLPVVMVSSATERGQACTLDALSAGAVDFVAKPSRPMGRGVQQMMLELRTKVKIASTARVGHWKRARPARSETHAQHALGVDIVALGASTGGTEAIRQVIQDLPLHTPGLLIVQHMPEGFTGPFARMLDESGRLECREARDGERVRPGLALVAPAGRQCRVQRRSGALVVVFGEPDRVCGHAPSVDVMMRSAAEAAGEKAVGVLLTGMGADGAQGMLALRQAGAYTIAQDEATSVVFGMPKAAWQCGGAAVLRPLDQIARTIVDFSPGGRSGGDPRRHR
jgi:two-component system chemotaxis response regulator CheB